MHYKVSGISIILVALGCWNDELSGYFLTVLLAFQRVEGQLGE